MMKKLLVLILVLGMATVSNAVLIQVNGVDPGAQATVNADTTAAISIVGEDTSNWIGYIIVEDGGLGALSNGQSTDNAGDPALRGITPYTEDGWGAGFELTVAGSPSYPVQVGTLFTMDYLYSGDLKEHPTFISLFVDPDYETPVDSVEIIPEPITIALLGLGGLFLRRRK